MLAPCYIEISAVSDDGYEDENPQKFFIEAFPRLLKRLRFPIERASRSGDVRQSVCGPLGCGAIAPTSTRR
jgi:hypothetical protein